MIRVGITWVYNPVKFFILAMRSYVISFLVSRDPRYVLMNRGAAAGLIVSVYPYCKGLDSGKLIAQSCFPLVSRVFIGFPNEAQMGALSLFKYNDGVPITTSLPRDCLQAERTMLLLSKTGAILCLMSFAVVMDFRLDTSGAGDEPRGHFDRRVFSLVLGALFFVLAMGALVLGTYNYFHSIRLYITEHRRTGRKLPMNVFVGFLVLTLLSLNIALLVDVW